MIFCFILIQTTVVIELNEDMSVLFEKMSCLSIFVSNLISFLIIKLKSKNIFILYNKLIDYQQKSFIGGTNNLFSTIVSVLITLINMSASINQHLYSKPNFKEVYNELEVNLKYIPIDQEFRLSVIHFYVISWIIFIQLFYYQFNTRYITIINSFIEEIKRKANKPDKNVLILTQRTIFDFTEFRSDFNKNINFIKYFIIINIIAITLMFINALFHININQIDYILYIIAFYGLFYAHILWTMTSSLRVPNIERELTLNLDKWQTLETEDFCFIEMKVLEKTVNDYRNTVGLKETVV
jgi:hypothetical protein